MIWQVGNSTVLLPDDMAPEDREERATMTPANHPCPACGRETVPHNQGGWICTHEACRHQYEPSAENEARGREKSVALVERARMKAGDSVEVGLAAWAPPNNPCPACGRESVPHNQGGWICTHDACRHTFDRNAPN